MFLPNRPKLQSEEIRGGGRDLKTETRCRLRYSKSKSYMPGDAASRTGPLITRLVKTWLGIYRVGSDCGCH